MLNLHKDLRLSKIEKYIYFSVIGYLYLIKIMTAAMIQFQYLITVKYFIAPNTKLIYTNYL